MIKRCVALLFFTCAASGAIREVKPDLHTLPPFPEPPTLAERIEQRARRAAMSERARAMRELAGVDSAPGLDSAAISNQVLAIRERGMMLHGLAAVVEDTRTNIVEVADLPDATIAGLYIAQMGKRAADVADGAHTNTIEKLIGAGMRQDIRGE